MYYLAVYAVCLLVYTAVVVLGPPPHRFELSVPLSLLAVVLAVRSRNE